jgi:hypothetical protein
MNKVSSPPPVEITCNVARRVFCPNLGTRHSCWRHKQANGTREGEARSLLHKYYGTFSLKFLARHIYVSRRHNVISVGYVAVYELDAFIMAPAVPY